MSIFPATYNTHRDLKRKYYAEGIKSYSETPFDHALSKRDNIKALINESMRKANSFVDDEDCRNISGMRQCKSELELLKSEVMALRMEGVPCGVGELDGYSQVDLETVT